MSGVAVAAALVAGGVGLLAGAGASAGGGAAVGTAAGAANATGMAVFLTGSLYVAEQAVSDAMSGRLSETEQYARKALAGSVVGFLTGASGLLMQGSGLGKVLAIGFGEGFLGSAATQALLNEDGEINWALAFGEGMFSAAVTGMAWEIGGSIKSIEGGSGAFATDEIISQYDDIYKYQYNATTNPGPLSEMGVAGNFYGGRYNKSILESDLILYRAGQIDKPLGQWFTREPLGSVAQVRADLAVKPQWINPVTGVLEGTSTIDCIYTIKIPKGTTIYSGPVGNQGGIYLGGLDIEQIFIAQPWRIDGVEVIGVNLFK